jgi:hypothetical protein
MASRYERKELSRLARRREDSLVSRGEVDPTPRAKKRGKTPTSHRYGVECRFRCWGRNGEWGPWHGWKWYATAARRDVALAKLSRELRDFMEYRKSER